MATLTVQQISRAGIDEDTGMVAAAAGLADNWLTTGTEFLRVKNAGGSVCNVTLSIFRTVDTQAVVNRVVAVPAGHTLLIGPFETQDYQDSSSRMNITYNQVASVTVGVFKAQ